MVKNLPAPDSYSHSCKLELLPPTVVKQAGSVRDDILQLCLVVIVSFHQQV